MKWAVVAMVCSVKSSFESFYDRLSRQFTESGQGRSMYVINESGVYALVFGSLRQGISSPVDDDDRGVQNMDTQGAFHHINK